MFFILIKSAIKIVHFELKVHCRFAILCLKFSFIKNTLSYLKNRYDRY